MKQTKDYDEPSYNFFREYKRELVTLFFLVLLFVYVAIATGMSPSDDRVIISTERKAEAMSLMSPYERVVWSKMFERTTYKYWRLMEEPGVRSDVEDGVLIHLLATRDEAPKNPKYFMCSPADYQFINRMFSLLKADGENDSYNWAHDDALKSRLLMCN